MLWRIPSADRRGRALPAFVGTFLAAVALHVTWDGSTSTTTIDAARASTVCA